MSVKIQYFFNITLPSSVDCRLVSSGVSYQPGSSLLRRKCVRSIILKDYICAIETCLCHDIPCSHIKPPDDEESQRLARHAEQMHKVRSENHMLTVLMTKMKVLASWQQTHHHISGAKKVGALREIE